VNERTERYFYIFSSVLLDKGVVLSPGRHEIDKNSLLEISLMARSFTWSNNQDSPIMSHIDSIFCTTDFDSIFPLATARALPRNPK
jgi:hypothetical protein